MKSEEISNLEKQINKLKFQAGLKASELHDLVEDRLYSDFENLIPLAKETYTICKEWNDLSKKLAEAKRL